MDPIVLLVVVLPGVVICAILLFAASRAERLIAESRDWPSVQGRITAARIRRTRNTRSPRIDYTYEVRGVEYRGNRLGFVQQSHSLAECQKILERFPPDSAVPVWYDPQKPSFSVLERAGNANALRIAGALVAGVFLLVVVILEIGR